MAHRQKVGAKKKKKFCLHFFNTISNYTSLRKMSGKRREIKKITTNFYVKIAKEEEEKSFPF